MKMTAPPTAYADQRVVSTDATHVREPARLSLFEEAWMQLACRRPRCAVSDATPSIAPRTRHEGPTNA
jgi:hypothetical protein